MTDAAVPANPASQRWVLRVGLYVLAAGIGGMFLLSSLERNILFPNPRAPKVPPTLPDGARREMLQTPVGTIEVVLLAPYTSTAAPAPVIIYCHGNGEIIDYSLEAFEIFRRAGYAILLPEYPGYGRTTGSPSEKSFQDSLAAAYDWLIEQPEIDPKKVIGHGRSLGGGAICCLAKVRPLAAVVLESTFTSTTDVAKKHYGWLSLLVRNRFDNLAVVSALKCPVLIMHGNRDRVIPVQHSEQLHVACPGSELIVFSCGHNDCEDALPTSLRFLRNQPVTAPATDRTSP